MGSFPDALLVDCAGTLIAPDPPVAEQYRVEARRLLPRVSLPDVSTVERRFRLAFRHPGLPPGTLRYGTTRTEGLWFWKRIVGAVFPGVDDPALERLTGRLFDRFARADSWAVRPGARDALDEVAGFATRLALVSNWDRRGPGLVARLELEDSFDAVLFSCREGVEKPDPALFRRALHRLDVPARGAVMLGNSPARDLRPARRLGLGALRFDPRGGDDDEFPVVSSWARLTGRLQDPGTSGSH